MKNRHYTPEQIAEIQYELHHTKNIRLQQRYQAIFLSMQGHMNKDVAQMMDLQLKTVGFYINHYLSEGLEGLIPLKQSGRPPFMTAEQSQALYEVIRDYTPHEVGFTGRFNWSAKLAARWVEEKFDIVYQESSMLQQLHQLGLSYTRPTYTLAKADPIKQEQFRKVLETKKKNLNNDIQHLLFEDESTIRDYQALMNTWFPVGEQKKIPTYGKHFSVKLTGILDYETGKVYVEESDSFNTEVFLAFLNRVLHLYPSDKIVMVLDNAHVHPAKLLTPFFKENPRLELLYLPPYSPQLNQIEGLWK